MLLAPVAGAFRYHKDTYSDVSKTTVSISVIATALYVTPVGARSHELTPTISVRFEPVQVWLHVYEEAELSKLLVLLADVVSSAIAIVLRFQFLTLLWELFGLQVLSRQRQFLFRLHYKTHYLR